MNKSLASIVCAAAIASGSLPALAADLAPAQTYSDSGARNGVKIGYLDCTIAGGAGYVIGSSKEVNCVFKSTIDGEPLDDYSGAMRKLGVDLGFTTEGRLIWAVLAPTAGYHHGSLAGLYQGASAEATIGLGVGANVLAGGTSGSIHLQLLSLQGQVGLNIAAAGTSMTLTSTK
jgi:hypothetical protein